MRWSLVSVQMEEEEEEMRETAVEEDTVHALE